MFPALQPHRPQYPNPHNQNTSSLQQHQQTRSASNTAPNVVVEDISNVDRSNMPMNLHSSHIPGSQMEAMPPHNTFAGVMPQHFDPATRHPVFFTPNLRKPPFPIPTFPATGFHPVATGYVFEQRRAMPQAGAQNSKNKL